MTTERLCRSALSILCFCSTLIWSFSATADTPYSSSEGACLCSPSGTIATCPGVTVPGSCPNGVAPYCPPSPQRTCPGFSRYTCFENPTIPPVVVNEQCVFWNVVTNPALIGDPGGSISINFDAGTPQCIANLVPGCLEQARVGAAAFYLSNSYASDPYIMTHLFRTCMITGLHGNPVITGNFYNGFHYLQVLSNGECNIDSQNIAGTPSQPGFCSGHVMTQITSYGSPISLVWEDGYDVDSQATLVSFPVDPAKANQLNTWKASSKAPLLVYDPEHTGIISAASQLFGDWTFGGQKVASLISNVSTKWENGYQALASLDQNGDDEISGVELQSLALWFDENRDGVSQTGEVKSLTQVGVTKLFFNPDRTDNITKSVHASRGFERTVNGRTVGGASVDWYAGISPVVTESLGGAGKLAAASNAPIINRSGDDSSFAKEAAEMTGLWNWSVQAGSDAWKVPNFKPQGAMAIMVNDSGIINMVPMITGRMSNLKTNLVAMRAYEHSGQLTRDTGGNSIASLESSAASSPYVRLISKLVFNPAKMTISGHTDAISTSSDGQSSTISYDWTATKANSK